MKRTFCREPGDMSFIKLNIINRYNGVIIWRIRI